jgi:hypothetical protein
VVGLVVVWVLLVGGGVALATVGHGFVGRFGGLGVGDGQFGENFLNGPSGVAVMGSSGDVFTVDQGIDPVSGAAVHRVQQFDAAGGFEARFPIDSVFYNTVGAIATDSLGGGLVYVVAAGNDSAGHVLKFSAAGVPGGELDVSTSGTTLNNIAFGQASPLAVDPADGTVYVVATDSTTGAQVVDSFSSAGTFIGSFDGSNGSPGAFQCPTGLAVDSSHQVYVLDSCSNRVDTYSATGVWGATVYDGSALAADGSSRAPAAVATDPSSGEVYVAAGGVLGLEITQFTAGGAAVVYTFDASSVGGARAMAVGGAGTVYVSDATDPSVARFTEFAGPTVSTDPATSVNARDAVLNGTINPEGVASSYFFEYDTDLSYRKRVPLVGGTSAGSGSVAVAALASVDGLQPNKLYHYRLVGFNSAGSIVGADQTLTTQVAPPTPDPNGSLAFASAITPRSATLHGTVNANNSFSGWRFEYGTTPAYGSAPFGGLLSDGDDQPVAIALTGLEPDTLYHFRVVAGSGFLLTDPQYGADQTFFTSPAAGGGARDVSTKRATLTATINPHGAATTYHFNYGPTASYGASTPETDGGHGAGGQQVAQQVTGLLPDTTYHVQVVATTDGVVHTGADGLFRTAPAPVATAIGPTGVTTNAATLGGELNTFGLTGSYRFDVWSLDSSYAVSIGDRPAAGNTGIERVNVALAGLPAGQRFVVQLTVSSNDTSTVSDLVTFATAEVPKVFPPPPASDTTTLYGCASPHLNAYNGKVKPGDTVKVTGSDLGVGANVILADRSLTVTGWSATGFQLTVPDDAKGTLALTIDCGHRSNTIALTVFQQPDNAFSIPNRSITGTTATVSVRVPGPGKIETQATNANAAKVTVRKAGTATVKVKLTSSGRKTLARAKSRTLKVNARVRYTPAGGRPKSKTITLTYKRKAHR